MSPLLVNSPSPPPAAHVMASPLLQRLQLAARSCGDAQPTADILVSWARAFVLFHNKQHPSTLGLVAVTHFLEHVVKTTPDPLLALAQARSALTVLYDDVLGIPLGELPQPRPPLLLEIGRAHV